MLKIKSTDCYCKTVKLSAKERENPQTFINRWQPVSFMSLPAQYEVVVFGLVTGSTVETKRLLLTLHEVGQSLVRNRDGGCSQNTQKQNVLLVMITPVITPCNCDDYTCDDLPPIKLLSYLISTQSPISVTL